jgi:tetratricopeptide (TPR) repeat protein
LACYTQAIKCDDTNADAVARRGQLYLERGEKGDIDRALSDFDRAIELNSNDDIALTYCKQPCPERREEPPMSLVSQSQEELQEMMQSIQRDLQRMQSPCEVQVCEGQQQRIQRLQEILKTSKESEVILVPKSLLSEVLLDEQRFQREAHTSDGQRQRIWELPEILQMRKESKENRLSRSFLEKLLLDEQMLWGVGEMKKRQLEGKIAAVNEELKERQASYPRDVSQIRADERRRVEDQLWTQWEDRQREKIRKRLQSLEGFLQVTKRYIQMCRNHLQSMDNGREIMQRLQTEELQLQGEIATLHEELEGLLRERLRRQIQRRVDNVLNRKQHSSEQLRHQIIELRGSILRDFRDLEPEEKLLKAEFQGVLQERWSHYNHPEQELVNILEYFLLEGGHNTSQPMSIKSREIDK